MSEDFGIQLSDDDSEEENVNTQQPCEIQGTLCKWTNYIHGWQNRFIILKDGKLSYYKNQNETSFGCRGAISVQRATVKPHEIDECRFDVCLNDCVWYLRTNTPEEKQQWVDAIEKQKECNGSTSHYGSNLSLTHSTASSSSSSFKRIKGGPHDPDSGLREKLSEIETYREIVVKQMETLQSYFDACAQSVLGGEMCNGGILALDHEIAPADGPPAPLPSGTSMQCSSPLPSPLMPSHEVMESHAPFSIDFRGEALTFKATTAGILTTLGHCVEVMNQREESFKRRLEKEVEKRRRLEEKLKGLSLNTPTETPHHTRYVVMGGPDYEEGPHSVIGEDEFYDAIESALDKMEEEEEFRERLRQKQRKGPQQPANKHPLWPEIEKMTSQQLTYAREAVEGGVWQLFNEDGEMKMYRRELEEEGLVVDPLKAIHQVRGVTAHEMAHHFWTPDVRFEWDTTIEQMTVLDTISEDTLIFLQLHKRVWPTAQRDALFWSHIRKALPENLEEGAHDTWIVCNKSTEHPDAPNDGKCVRVDLVVCLVCQTFLDQSQEDELKNEEGRGGGGSALTRDNLICKITYCSVVNPGGWAPASVLRSVYKREYPKFLKRFTQYVIDKCQDQPIAFSGLKIHNHSKHWRG